MPRVVAERGDIVLGLSRTFLMHGFDGASLSVIQEETGFGRGSLYHFFPGGKADMAHAVLDEVQVWFEREVFLPLHADDDPVQQISGTTDAIATYFSSRQVTCLFASMTLSREHEAFSAELQKYFTDWIDALTSVLRRGGSTSAADDATDAVATIQGALLISRALNAPERFEATLHRVRHRLICSLPTTSEGLPE
jgi:TetR/AcrR family transcriptional regulator, lmrAB and yxaGH operons repressor